MLDFQHNLVFKLPDHAYKPQISYLFVFRIIKNNHDQNIKSHSLLKAV